MLLLLVAAIFVALIVFSMPIVFALGVAGTAGLIISVLNAYYVFLKYAKLAALQQATSAGTRPGA